MTVENEAPVVLLDRFGKEHKARPLGLAFYRLFREHVRQQRLRAFLDYALSRKEPEHLVCPHCHKMLDPPPRFLTMEEIRSVVPNLMARPVRAEEIDEERMQTAGSTFIVWLAMKEYEPTLKIEDVEWAFDEVSILQAYLALEAQSLPDRAEKAEDAGEQGPFSTGGSLPNVST